MDAQNVRSASWRRSRHCNGGSCVEVAQTPAGMVAVRDSKNPAGAPLVFTPAEWRNFTDQAKRSFHDAAAVSRR